MHGVDILTYIVLVLAMQTLWYIYFHILNFDIFGVLLLKAHRFSSVFFIVTVKC